MPRKAYVDMLEAQRNAARARAMLSGRESLSDYVGKLSPTYEIPEWSKKAIFPVFQAARSKPQRICISAPPRHGKTYPTLHAVAQWCRDFRCDTSAYATFNSRRGKSKSKLIRQLARRSGVELDPSMQNLDEWRTAQGGGMLAGGLAGGGLTGEGIQGMMVVDDPFPTMKSAESAAYRQEVWDAFNAVVMTRLEGASVVVIQTRWHSDDLIGRLEKVGGWNIINIPAIAEAGDPLGREVGSPLDPKLYPVNRADSRYAREALSDIERQLGPYVWSALYQGQPRSKGMKIFGAPHFYDPTKFDIEGCRIVIGADPAASEKTSADHSAAVVMAVKGREPDATYYVLDVWRGQVQVPDFVAVLHALQNKWHGAPVAVESASGFKGVAQALRRLNRHLSVIEMIPRENKFMRAQPVAAAWNDGRVLVPMQGNAPGQIVNWMGEYYSEMDKFTGVADAEDDQVDATAHAFNIFEYAPEVYRGSKPSP